MDEHSEMNENLDVNELSASTDNLQPEKSFSFPEILSRYEGPLLRYVSRLLTSSVVNPEDIIQDTFMKLHKKVKDGTWKDIANMQAWLYRVAHNLVMDVGRKRVREKEYQNKTVEEMSGLAPKQEFENLEKMIQDETKRKVLAQVDLLDEKEKQVILLKVMEGMTLKEITAITGTNISTVSYWLNKAMRSLAERLKEECVI
ncbi:MAG: hypothetical protein COA79_20130 [Planctomycetota bacterium]|nr:MAG: hypothetical protein COA79_20130 [Planctomycetota bacterium]